MIDRTAPTSNENIGVSLVDGDATIRHARQIMLRSERYDVRSYATCAALLADRRSRGCRCIVVDVDLTEGDGLALLQEMRATGWRGRAILLDRTTPGSSLISAAERQGDEVLERTIADGPLLVAIAASVDRALAG